MRAMLPAGWVLHAQVPSTLASSEPESDVALALGTRPTDAARHPGPPDLGLVVEVADSSLPIDRNVKAPLYGSAGIPVY